jgi:hypothetical protein
MRWPAPVTALFAVPIDAVDLLPKMVYVHVSLTPVDLYVIVR